jgi:hypothetical protein
MGTMGLVTGDLDDKDTRDLYHRFCRVSYKHANRSQVPIGI